MKICWCLRFWTILWKVKALHSFLDDAYKETRISGYLPVTSKRSALQQLAFAIGALVDTML